MRRRLYSSLAGLLLLPAVVGCIGPTGCTVAESVHPLSDEKTFVADERLLGTWVYVDITESEEPKEQEDQEPLEVRRTADGKGYEIMNLEDQEKKVPLLVTELAGHRFFTMLARDELDDRGRFRYLIVHYELPSDDVLHLHLLHPERTEQAVKQGKLAGEIQYEDPEPGDDPNAKREVMALTITATTEQLREYFATQEGRALFCREKPALIFKRVEK